MRPVTVLAYIFAGVVAACGGRVSDKGGALDGGTPSGDARTTDGSGDAGTEDAAVESGRPDEAGFDNGAAYEASSDATAGACLPLPGCSSGTSCPSGDGCNTCTCEKTIWQCTGFTCPGDAGGNNQGCPPSTDEPSDGTPCGADMVCVYPSACAEEACVCQSGAWSCHLQLQNCEGGMPANACPKDLPPQGGTCPLSGTACEYATCPGGLSTNYDTNCLCVTDHWDCATIRSCDGGS
jgi:hypothetical protein